MREGGGSCGRLGCVRNIGVVTSLLLCYSSRERQTLSLNLRARRYIGLLFPSHADAEQNASNRDEQDCSYSCTKAHF